MAATVPTRTPARAETTTAADEDRRSRGLKTRRGGRPSRAGALRLSKLILEVATEQFLTEGYAATTIEAVAGRAGISKRTLYHRFADKAALFAAVVHQIIEGLRPPAEVPLVEGSSLHEILRHLAGLILRAAVSPQAIALHRLIVAESARFPELVRAVNTQGGAREATDLIGTLLAREFNEARLPADARSFAAEQFLQMVIAVPQRRAIGLGTAMTESEVETWADYVARLFLNGCDGWQSASVPKPGGLPR
jgi:TetR/AcrR family transcriptional repressor of mexJK operon